MEKEMGFHMGHIPLKKFQAITHLWQSKNIENFVFHFRSLQILQRCPMFLPKSIVVSFFSQIRDAAASFNCQLNTLFETAQG